MVPQLPIKRPAWMEEFHSFIMRGNVVDLAVGIIIGAAFTAIVGSLVKDIINPIIGVLIGGVDFSNIFFSLDGKKYANLADAAKAGAPTVNIGLFINAIIQFLIVAFVIFWVVKSITRLTAKQMAEEIVAPPTPPPSELLLAEIRDILRQKA